MNRASTRVAIIAGLSLLGLAFAAPAQADVGDCQTSVTNLVNRPDRGHGADNDGIWALDTFVRTVKICEVEPPPQVAELAINQAWYKAVAVDKGTFKTIEGDNLSPNEGEALAGDVLGTLDGGFVTNTFQAAADFITYNDKHDGKTYTGSPGGDNPTTGNWVASLFTDKVDAAITDYGWTYKTCSEQWVETSKNDDGQGEGAGDITGKPCPTPSPSRTTPSPSPSTTPPAPGLPVTGVDVGTIAIIGGSVILLGIATLFLARRFRRA